MRSAPEPSERLRDRIPLHLVVFLAYNVVMSVAVLTMPAPYGLLVALLLFWLTMRLYVLREPSGADRPRAEVLRLAPLSGGPLLWMLLLTPLMLVLIWAMSELYVSLVPVPPEVFNPFGPLLRDPLGRLSIAVLAIGIAPVLEEFFFRGLIQHRLQQRWGAAAGIGLAALLFALVHVQPWVFPLHFALGVIFGWAVYVTGSIWAGVLLHAANNVAAVIGLRTGEDPLTRPTIWEVGIDADWWSALLILAVSLVAVVWVAGRLVRSTRPG